MHKEINCGCRHSNSPLTGCKCNHVISGILTIQSLAGIFSWFWFLDQNQLKQLNRIRPTRQGEAKLASWHPLIQPELRSPQLCMCYISACYTSFVLKTDHFYVFFIYFIYHILIIDVSVLFWFSIGFSRAVILLYFLLSLSLSFTKHKINNLCMCKPTRW